MTRKTVYADDVKSAIKQAAFDRTWRPGFISNNEVEKIIDSLPAAEPDAGERVERPPMLLAATCRPFAPITDWHWCVRSADDWLVVDSDMWFIYSKDFIGVDRAASDEAALRLYDHDNAASRPATS